MKKSYKCLAAILSTFITTFIAFNALGADKLIVKDLTDKVIFKVGDTGRVFANEYVGIGTETPLRALHIRGNNAVFRLDRDLNSSGFLFTRTAPGDFETIWKSFFFGVMSSGVNNGEFIIHDYGTATGGGGGNTRLIIKNNGYIGIGTTDPTHLLQLSGGAYSDGPTWVNASSRELKENIKEVSAEEAVATLVKLEPVQYNYKADKEEQYVGFIAEDVPDLVAVNDRKGLSAMDITAVLTKVVQEQQKTIAELQERLAEVEIAMQFKKDKVLALTMLQE